MQTNLRTHNTARDTESSREKLRLVFHRRYRQDPQDGPRVLKFASGVSLAATLDGKFSDVTRSYAKQGRGALARHSGYLAPASDIPTFLYGRAESHWVVTKTPRSASSASSRSNSAFSLSGSASANLRYLAARSWLMATHLPTQYLSTKPGFFLAKK